MNNEYQEFRQHFYNDEKLDKSSNQKEEKITQKSKILSKISNELESPYDIVIDIDSLKAQKFGWLITENLTKKIQANKEFCIIGLVGRENIGKTYILNKICEFNLPSGSNVNTKGLSLKYAENRNLICLDSAGIQTPVYYYDKNLMERFNVTKEQLKDSDSSEDIRREMINDRTITDIFIQDFIMEVCEVILIVTGQLSQNDQKFIERIAGRYKSKKKIIIVHNFSNLYSVKDVERKIEKDIIKAFDTIPKKISDTDLFEYVEKNKDKTKENISHLVLGVDWAESGLKYNEHTFEYLRDIFDTRIDHKTFNIYNELTKFLEENYRLYMRFKERLDNPVTLSLKNDRLYIESDKPYEISNPIFNSLGNLVTTPPFEMIESEENYVILLEIPDLNIKTLNMAINKKLNEFNCLVISGIKNYHDINNQDIKNITVFRNYGDFKYIIPLGRNFISVEIKEKKYKKGILTIEVSKMKETIIKL